ncbi:MAG: preprotein translocase subunit SecG [Kiloniellaceae bacterium]
MINVLLVIHLMLAIGLIGVVLLQRSEGGGLGIGGGGGGGMSGFLTGRGTANLLTRTTATLAACFMATSILLSILSTRATEPRSILDELPAAAPVEQQPAQPTVPVQ